MSNKSAMIKKLGSEEAYKSWLKRNGSKGGQISKSPPDHPTRFDNNRALAIRANKIRHKKLDNELRQA